MFAVVDLVQFGQNYLESIRKVVQMKSQAQKDASAKSWRIYRLKGIVASLRTIAANTQLPEPYTSLHDLADKVEELLEEHKDGI